MLKVLVTGANGAIGSMLTKELELAGYQLLIQEDKKLRIEDDAYYQQFKDPESIDVIYHLAAKTFVPDSWQDPVKFTKVNVLGTNKVLEFCRKYNIQLVYISSYAYGIPAYLPIDEDHPVSAVNPYGLSKIFGENLCKFYGDHFDLSYIIVRPFNVLGMLNNKKLLIPEIIEQIKQAKAITVKDLKPKRDYVFIDDLIAFLVTICGQTNNEIYNIGSGRSYAVEDIISIMQTVYGTQLPVHSSENERKNEIPETCADISKAKRDFNWTPRITFEEGVKMIKNRT